MTLCIIILLVCPIVILYQQLFQHRVPSGWHGLSVCPVLTVTALRRGLGVHPDPASARRAGFHSVPSMRHLHLHVISTVSLHTPPAMLGFQGALQAVYMNQHL